MDYIKQLITAIFVFLHLAPALAQTGEAAFFANNEVVIKAKLNNPAFGVPVVIHSNENVERLSAEVYGKLSYPFNEVQDALVSPANWCEIVTLNLNIKACTHEENHKVMELNFYVGRKIYETPDDAYLLNYQYQLKKITKNELSIILTADKGPMGTSNYRIELQIIPAAAGTYLRIRTSYQPSLFSRLATSTYLTTLGRNKEGFSVVATAENGNPLYAKGVKGVVERNVMRYYLATVAFLDTRELPQDDRFSKRSQRWFDLTEQFARQLHEMERAEYLNIKYLERQNQNVLQARLNSF